MSATDRSLIHCTYIEYLYTNQVVLCAPLCVRFHCNARLNTHITIFTLYTRIMQVFRSARVIVSLSLFYWHARARFAKSKLQILSAQESQSYFVLITATYTYILIYLYLPLCYYIRTFLHQHVCATRERCTYTLRFFALHRKQQRTRSQMRAPPIMYKLYIMRN